MAVDRFELSEKLRWVQENVDLLAESSIEFPDRLRLIPPRCVRA